MPPPAKNLDDLARSLLADGPVKSLPASPKRVRIQLGGLFVADSTEAVYVWEHGYYPTYYLPLSSFAAGALSYPNSTEEKGYALATLSVPNKSTDRVVVFSPTHSGGVLRGLVRVEFGAADAWYEEDARVDVHPKDPFKRVDVIFSSRPVRVFVNGVEVAHSTSSFQLYETGLPVRFYLPATSVAARFLRHSDTLTVCPYKGEANYYDVVVPSKDEGSAGGGEGRGGKGEDEVLRDGIWYYKNPKLECAAIAGCLCFYNEKVDIELDGKMLARPKTPFS